MPTSKEQFQPELTEVEKEQARQPIRLDSAAMLRLLGKDRGPTPQELAADPEGTFRLDQDPPTGPRE